MRKFEMITSFNADYLECNYSAIAMLTQSMLRTEHG